MSRYRLHDDRPIVAFNERESRVLIALLDLLNEHIEAEADACTMVGESFPRPETNALYRDLRLRRRSEELLIRLCDALTGKKAKGGGISKSEELLIRLCDALDRSAR